MMHDAMSDLSPPVIRMKEPGRQDDFARKTRQPVIWFEVEDFSDISIIFVTRVAYSGSRSRFIVQPRHSMALADA